TPRRAPLGRGIPRSGDRGGGRRLTANPPRLAPASITGNDEKAAAHHARRPAPDRNSAPAALDDEGRVAAAVHPHAGAVPAPVAPLDAARVGMLALDAHVAAAAGVHLAQLVAVVAAGAAHADVAVPARARLPPAVAVAASACPAPRDAEHAFAAAVDPHAGAVPAPRLPFDAPRVRDLADQLHGAALPGVDLAHRIPVVAARATDFYVAIPARTRLPARLCRHRGNDRNEYLGRARKHRGGRPDREQQPGEGNPVRTHDVLPEMDGLCR